MNLSKIIGKKVISIKGFCTNKRKSLRHIEPEFIMFDDKKTYIQLREQDYFTFHDCSSIARNIDVFEDAKDWKRIMEDNKTYPAATMDI